MLYVTGKHLKPGMILAKDIMLYNKSSFNTLLLSKGHVLNNSYINKILYQGIDGAYIESESFSDIIVEPYINDRLKSKALTQIKDVYYDFQMSSNKINAKTVNKISDRKSTRLNSSH